MKKILFPIIALIIASCGSNPSVAPTVIDEKYEPTDDFPFGSVKVEGLVDDPEGWDSMHIGYMSLPMMNSILHAPNFRESGSSSLAKQRSGRSLQIRISRKLPLRYMTGKVICTTVTGAMISGTKKEIIMYFQETPKRNG